MRGWWESRTIFVLPDGKSVRARPRDVALPTIAFDRLRAAVANNHFVADSWRDLAELMRCAATPVHQFPEYSSQNARDAMMAAARDWVGRGNETARLFIRTLPEDIQIEVYNGAAAIFRWHTEPTGLKTRFALAAAVASISMAPRVRAPKEGPPYMHAGLRNAVKADVKSLARNVAYVYREHTSSEMAALAALRVVFTLRCTLPKVPHLRPLPSVLNINAKGAVWKHHREMVALMPKVSAFVDHLYATKGQHYALTHHHVNVVSSEDVYLDWQQWLGVECPQIARKFMPIRQAYPQKVRLYVRWLLYYMLRRKLGDAQFRMVDHSITERGKKN